MYSSHTKCSQLSNWIVPAIYVKQYWTEKRNVERDYNNRGDERFEPEQRENQRVISDPRKSMRRRAKTPSLRDRDGGSLCSAAVGTIQRTND